MQKWKLNIINSYAEQIKNGFTLGYVHIPKTGGTFARWVFEEIPEIKYLYHNQAKEDEKKIFFATIREPADRFESLLNMTFWFNNILKRNLLDHHLPKRMHHVFHNKNISLDETVSLMTDADIKHIQDTKAFASLDYYSKNVGLMITIDEFLPTLNLLGFTIKKQYVKNNVSEKLRGKFSIETKRRIRKLFSKDFKIWNLWTRKD
jgi:hypothetical protein